MIATPDLIETLAAGLTPVRRLRPPILRAVGWLGLAALVLALLAISQGVRVDLVDRLQTPPFAIGVAAALLTGVSSAVATFMLGLPDRSRKWVFLPVPTLCVWLSTIGYQCLSDWVEIGPAGVRFGEAAQCFATLVLTSLPLSLAMFVMVRMARPLSPTVTTLMGSLAVAALTATALSLYHTVDATLMILLFNVGTAVLLVGLGGLFGWRLFPTRPRATE